jgi:hypothetical protein
MGRRPPDQVAGDRSASSGYFRCRCRFASRFATCALTSRTNGVPLSISRSLAPPTVRRRGTAAPCDGAGRVTELAAGENALERLGPAKCKRTDMLDPPVSVAAMATPQL